MEQDPKKLFLTSGMNMDAGAEAHWFQTPLPKNQMCLPA